MLQVQVEYWKQGEEVRHDQEMEALERNKQQETQRANRAQEELRYREVAETGRHNLENESIAREQNRISQMNAESQRMNAESQRISALASERTSYANQQQAYASTLQAQAAQVQAHAAQRNAETNRLQYQEQVSQNIRSNNLRTLENSTKVMIAGYEAKAKESVAKKQAVSGIVGNLLGGIARIAGGAIN